MTIEGNQIQTLQNSGLFEVKPCNANLDDVQFSRVKTTPVQKTQMSALFSQLPAFASSGALSKAYTIRFPEGVSGTLMHYKNGGIGTPIIGENGIVDHAALFELRKEAALLGGFSALAAITGQYFLTEINSKFELINKKIDEILDFLYGEKKAELVSEVTFVQYAQRNYASIMAHESQRIATIASLQAAKKVAMKDVEFYMSDLSKKGNDEAKEYESFKSLVKEVQQKKESLDLSVQLYVMSSLMELYFSQNTDPDYVADVQEELTQYVRKCDSRVCSIFSVLENRNSGYKSNMLKKIDTAPLALELDKIIKPLQSGEESQMQKSIKLALESSANVREYYLKEDGTVYISA